MAAGRREEPPRPGPDYGDPAEPERYTHDERDRAPVEEHGEAEPAGEPMTPLAPPEEDEEALRDAFGPSG